MTSTITVTNLTPGQLHTVVAYVWVGDFLHVRLQAGTEQSEVLAPGGWRPVSLQFTPASTTESVTLVKHSGDGIAYLDILTPVLGEYDGEPFDGNTPPRGLTNYGWADAEDASQSIRQETPLSLTILDTTPTINGRNEYIVRVETADGATRDTLAEIITDEQAWAYLNSGESFDRIVRVKRRLNLASAPSRTSTIVKTAGRKRPIALFGENTDLYLRGSAVVLDDAVAEQVGDGGSSISDIEDFLLTAGRVCYRDPTGRRVFGVVEGSFINRDGASADFVYEVTEAS